MSERSALPSPASLLARCLRGGPARPFVTYYDLAADGRVELSVATFDNWTSKTANMLVDELDVEPGDEVSVVLPAHWLGLVWAMAVWTVGARLRLEPTDASVRVRAMGEHDAGHGELVVVNPAPLGGPVGPAAPAGGHDFGREVLGFPDGFVPVSHDVGGSLAEQMAQVEATTRGGRRLLVADRLDQATVRDGLLGPLLTDGSVVLVRPGAFEPAAERVAQIAATERAVSPPVDPT